MTTTSTAAVDAPPTWGERFFGVLAYLCWMSPLAYAAPLVLYFWKGRTSRFIGFHTVQSTLLGFTILFLQVAVAIPVMYFSGTATTRAGMVVAQAAFYAWLVFMACTPLGCCFWMAISVLLGRPAVAPVVGRWAKQVIARP